MLFGQLIILAGTGVVKAFRSASAAGVIFRWFR